MKVINLYIRFVRAQYATYVLHRGRGACEINYIKRSWNPEVKCTKEIRQREEYCEAILSSFVRLFLLFSVLAPQTADTLLERVFEAVRLVQICVVGRRDVGVLAVVARNRCRVALVEHALTFLLLVL